jgi:hypothetical protein
MAAYKQLALKYHPDTNQSPDATRKMQELNEAYAVLSEPASRAGYDLERDRRLAIQLQAARQAREQTGQGQRAGPDLRSQGAAGTAGWSTQKADRAVEEQQPRGHTQQAPRTQTETARATPPAERFKSSDKVLALGWVVTWVVALILLYRLCQMVLPSVWSNSPWWWLGLALPPVLAVPVAVAVAFRLEAYLRRARRPEPE